MDTSFKKENDVGHLYLVGDMDLLSKRMIENSAKNAIQQCNHLHVHMDKVDYVDSSGLSALLLIATSLVKENKTFIITGANERVKNLFKITNFDRFLLKNAVDTIIDDTKKI